MFVAAGLALCFVLRDASAFNVIPTSGAPLIVQLNQGTLLRLDQTPKSVVIANSRVT